MTLVAVLVAFIGFAGYNVLKLKAAWHLADFVNGFLSLGAAVTLALVPWFATRPSEAAEHLSNLEKARRLYLLGLLLTVSTMLIFVINDSTIHP